MSIDANLLINDNVWSVELLKYSHFYNSLMFSFFENIDRICKPDYVPTNQDILRSRVPTSGVVKLVFELKDIQFKYV